MLNKIKIQTIILIILLISTSYTVTATKEKESTREPILQIGIFGASFAGGFKKTGFIIYNKGDEPIVDIQYVFSIKGGADNDIDYSYSKEIEPLNFNSAYQFITNEVHGFGVVTLSLSVSSSNAGDKNLSISAFQIGPFTISRPWIFSWCDVS